eukprot:2024454-Prymnesium_polylepis.1
MPDDVRLSDRVFCVCDLVRLPPPISASRYCDAALPRGAADALEGCWVMVGYGGIWWAMPRAQLSC